MSKKKLIDAIEVKSPCSESWDEMEGNEQVRFCSHCSKSVNNLSEMTRREAVRLVRASGGDLCIRYIKHPKTSKPLFAENLYRITRRAPGLAAGVITATVSLSAAAYAQGGSSLALERAPAANERVINSDREINELARSDGRIRGTVTDSQGAVIPGIPISLTNEKTNETRKAASNEIGYYEFTGLPSGTYKLQFAGSMGFAAKDVRGISVPGEDNSSQDVTLDANLEVTVSGGAMISLPNLEHPITTACQNEDIVQVKDLISRGARVNVREKYSSGITPLFIAVENGNRAIAEVLIRFGAKVNARNSDRRTPLMLVDDDAEDGLVELLVQNGAKVDLVDKEGNTALILAAEAAEVKTVKALIAAGAGVNFQNRSGDTALMKAADRNDLEMVRALILAGADVNLKNEDDDTAWDLATEGEVEELLESYGGDGGLPDDEPDEETVPERPRQHNSF